MANLEEHRPDPFNELAIVDSPAGEWPPWFELRNGDYKVGLQFIPVASSVMLRILDLEVDQFILSDLRGPGKGDYYEIREGLEDITTVFTALGSRVIQKTGKVRSADQFTIDRSYSITDERTP